MSSVGQSAKEAATAAPLPAIAAPKMPTLSVEASLAPFMETGKSIQ